jgi:UDP-N-acetyl-2-amino-2-deoxyglucuronate dehydrogenase
MVRVGVVGCGAIHGTHCEALQKIEGAKLEAVYDVLPEKARAAAEKFGTIAAKSYADFLSRVDAVSVCVPSGLHSKVAVRAAKAGKHVISEKPIDVSYAHAKSMVDAARAAGVKLAVVSQHRFSNDMRKMRQAAQSGEFGRLVQGDMYNKWYRTQAYYDSGDWRGTWKLDGGGCLMNQGIHYVDMLQWIMGGVKSVRALIRTASHDIEVEDTAIALLEYRNGAVGVIQGSTSIYPGLSERIEIHGDCGTAIIEGDKIKLWKVDPDAPKDPSPYGGGVMQQPTPKENIIGEAGGQGGASDPTAIWGEQHRLQLEDFVRAIRDDREPFITGEDALEPLRIILAIYASGRRNGAAVTV